MEPNSKPFPKINQRLGTTWSFRAKPGSYLCATKRIYTLQIQKNLNAQSSRAEQKRKTRQSQKSFLPIFGGGFEFPLHERKVCKRSNFSVAWNSFASASMADPSAGPASFWTQANALFRKNVTYQVSLFFPRVLRIVLRIWKEMKMIDYSGWWFYACFSLLLIIFWHIYLLVVLLCGLYLIIWTSFILVDILVPLMVVFQMDFFYFLLNLSACLFLKLDFFTGFLKGMGFDLFNLFILVIFVIRKQQQFNCPYVCVLLGGLL